MKAIKFERIWDDVDFYEIAISVQGTDIKTKMPGYVTDKVILELSDGLHLVGTNIKEEYTWEVNINSYVFMKIYKFNSLGKICIDVILDNKSEKPYKKRVEFSMMVEANSVIEFSKQLKGFVSDNKTKVEGIYLAG